MSTDQPLSNEKSLEIIHQMISQAKTNITDSGFRWLLWGIMLFITSLSTYIFINIGSANIFLAWNIFGAITIVLLIYDIVTPKRKPVRTYVDEMLKLVDIGFATCIFMIIFSINTDAVHPDSGFGFFLMIFAFLMLIKGGAIRSRPLMIGAAVNWAGAIAIFIIKDFKYAMLIMAGAVLAGYIIPGLLLRSKYKKENNIRQK
jgi:hypothetical protein